MNSFMYTHEELKDLVIFDLETGEDVHRYSAEYVTSFGLNALFIHVMSSQEGDGIFPDLYSKDKYGFYFVGR